MELTTNSRNYLNKSAVGYMVNTSLRSRSSIDKIKQLQDIFVSELQGTIWTTPPSALHVTLLDWLAPLVDYGDDKDELFEKLRPEYDTALSSILERIKPIDVTFNNIIISPSAIVIVADEQSTHIFNKIRQEFLKKINLLPDTKKPPTIVHSTIARFVGEIDLDTVRRIADSLNISFSEHIDNFQLVRETKLPMLKYSVIKAYNLGLER